MKWRRDPKASASGERLIVARGIEAWWPRRLAARCTRARSAVSGCAQRWRLEGTDCTRQYLLSRLGEGWKPPAACCQACISRVSNTIKLRNLAASEPLPSKDFNEQNSTQYLRAAKDGYGSSTPFWPRSVSSIVAKRFVRFRGCKYFRTVRKSKIGIPGTNSGSDLLRCLSFRQREDLLWFQCRVSDKFVGLSADNPLKSYASRSAGVNRHGGNVPQSAVPRRVTIYHSCLRSPAPIRSRSRYMWINVAPTFR